MDNKISYKKDSFIKVFLFMYLIFPFTFASHRSIQVIFYYLVVMINLYFLFIECKKNTLSKSNFQVLFIFFSIYLFMMLNSLIVPFIYGTNDFSFFSNLVTYLIKIIIITVIVRLCTDVHDFFRLFFKATALYVLFTTFFLIPSVRLIVQDIFYNPAMQSKTFLARMATEGLRNYTRFGLQGFSGFEHTLKCSIGLLFALYEYSLSDKKRRLNYFVYMFINFVGCVFYGRIGILSSLTCLGLYFLYQIIIHRKYKLLILSFILLIILVSSFLIFYDLLESYAITRWMFEPFLNIVRKGSFETSSSDSLKNMYSNLDFSSLVFGEGKYMEHGHYYKHIDVGYLRPAMFWGIIGSIPYYFITILLLISLYLNLNKKNCFFLVSVLFLFNGLYELKGETNLCLLVILYAANLTIFFEKRHKQFILLSTARHLFHFSY